MLENDELAYETNDNLVAQNGFEDLDFSDFSNIEIDAEVEFETRYVKPPKTRQIPEHLLKYDKAVNLAKEIDLEVGGFCIVDGSFIFGDFIEALIVEKNLHVQELTISTLSMSENNVDSLHNLLAADYVDNLNLIISDYFFSHERGNLIPYIYQELDIEDKFQLGVACSHTKTVLIQTHCGMKIIIDGSANLRSSGCLEQFRIEQNEQIYDELKKYQDWILNTYSTINKSIRGKELWHQEVKQKKSKTTTKKQVQENQVQQSKGDWLRGKRTKK